MSIIKTFTEQDFIYEFQQSSRSDQFSHDALVALFEYFEEFESFEMDVIAICCDFTEFDTEEYLLSVYSDHDSIEEIRDNTLVFELDNGAVLIANF